MLVILIYFYLFYSYNYMDNINKQLDNIDNIINNIKQINVNNSKNLKNILKIKNNNYNKKILDDKINLINSFSNKLNDIIIKKPNPNLLDKELVEYIGYDNYYNESI